MAARAVRDCLTCGACCFSDRRESEGYVYVTPEEEEKLRGRHPKLPIIQTEIGTRNTRDGLVCAALKGRIGVKVTCAIYKDRPQLCREFLKGSGDCRFARRFWGWDPSEA